MLGLDVLMGYAGQVSLGQAGFMAIGGYTAAILAVKYGWPPLLGTAAGIVLSLVCALVLSLTPCGCAASISRSLRSPSACWSIRSPSA